MHDYADFFARGRVALLEGKADYERPPVEGGARWGAAAVLRPVGLVLEQLTDLAKSVGEAAGPGHWIHGCETLHFTLRSLERYRQVVPDDDPCRLAYAASLGEAVAGLPPVRIELRGVSPHVGGVLAVGYPVDDNLVTLQRRFAQSLRFRGVGDFESWVRDRWYVSLVHFAAPVTDPEAVVDWCDEHADVPIGLAEIKAADIVQAVHTGVGIRLNTLERSVLA
ncbi:hypothetical protein ABZ297_15165 [Nonomuraea sp. NPDC005983]|uniref:hypothetical protein n=1 Tax=Nonomuraea sp. NPDC005983 TaxID=3155595 RepID=UPI0033B3472D